MKGDYAKPLHHRDAQENRPGFEPGTLASKARVLTATLPVREIRDRDYPGSCFMTRPPCPDVSHMGTRPNVRWALFKGAGGSGGSLCGADPVRNVVLPKVGEDLFLQ